jgi:hypothetical protein
MKKVLVSQTGIIQTKLKNNNDDDADATDAAAADATDDDATDDDNNNNNSPSLSHTPVLKTDQTMTDPHLSHTKLYVVQ